MKFAIVDNLRVEATPNTKGFCPYCGSEVIAKCGNIKIHHWSHKSKRNCDHWWENETEWHRSWKDKFPSDWQEDIQHASNGERHIADVKTDAGWVLEFQHSSLKPEERKSRNTFYEQLVWVVDGTRRVTDVKQFTKILNESTAIWKEPLILCIDFPEEVRLLKEWHNDRSLVFFDFKQSEEQKSILWFLYPQISSSKCFLSRLPRLEFIDMHNNNKFDAMVQEVISPIQEILTKKYRR